MSLQLPPQFKDFLLFFENIPHKTIGDFMLDYEETNSAPQSVFTHYFKSTAYDPYLLHFGSDGSGGIFALWQPLPDKEARVVFLDSEAAFQYVIGDTFDDFLRFLAIGYRDFDKETIAVKRESPNFIDVALPDPRYSAWIENELDLNIPAAGTDIVSADDTELFVWIKDTDPYLAKRTWDIVPYVSVGPISWNMSRAEIALLFKEDTTASLPLHQGFAAIAELAKQFGEVYPSAQELSKTMGANYGHTVLYTDIPYASVTFENDGPQAKLVSITLPRGANIQLEGLDFSKTRPELIKDLYIYDKALIEGRATYSPKYGLSINSTSDNYTVVFSPIHQQAL
jgi:hypothetical protein